MWKSILVLTVMMLGLNAYSINDPGSEEVISKVEEHLDRGEFKAAFKVLDNALKENPADYVLLTKRGELYILVERWKDASRDLDKALQLDDQYAPAYYSKASFNMNKGLLDSAEVYLDKAVAFNEDNGLEESILSMRGEIHLQKGELFEAEGYLLQAGMKSEVSLNTMKNLAEVLHLRGKDEEAIIILKETLQIFGEDLESFVNTGYISNQIGMYDEAMSFLDEALKIDPTNPIALSNMAYAQFKTGVFEQALKTINRSLDNDNSNAYAYRVKGEILATLGDSNRACRELKKAVNAGYAVQFDEEEITLLIIDICNRE